MGRQVVHFEINTPDNDANAAFYRELFGWNTTSFDAGEGSYHLVDTHAGRGINGGLGKTDDGSTGVVFYVAVPDTDETLQQIESLGGKTIMPTTAIPNVVTFAIFADPQGNVVGLVKDEPHEHAPGEEHDHGPSAGDGAPVAWFELLSSDARAAWDFYGQVFGWESDDADATDFAYGEVSTTGDAIGGGIGRSPDGLPHATVYAEVADVQQALDRAVALGATRTMGPLEVTSSTKVGVFTDPQGATFGVYSRR